MPLGVCKLDQYFYPVYSSHTWFSSHEVVILCQCMINYYFQTNSTNREPASKALLRVVLHRTYSHAVFDPEKLNSYQPFSAEVSNTSIC